MEDFQLKYLPTVRDIKQTFVYLTKDLNQIPPDNGFYVIQYSMLNDLIHSNYIEQLEYNPLFDTISKFVTYYKFLEDKSINPYGSKNKTSNLTGYRFGTKESETFLIIYYLSLYFQLKNMLIYKNNLYCKIPKTLLSIKLIGDMNYFK